MASRLNISPSILIGGSLSLVAGLAWNDAFSESIRYYYPLETKSSLRARYLYAAIVTIVIVLIGYIIITIESAASTLLQSSYAVLQAVPQLSINNSLKAAVL